MPPIQAWHCTPSGAKRCGVWKRGWAASKAHSVWSWTRGVADWPIPGGNSLNIYSRLDLLVYLHDQNKFLTHIFKETQQVVIYVYIYTHTLNININYYFAGRPGMHIGNSLDWMEQWFHGKEWDTWVFLRYFWAILATFVICCLLQGKLMVTGFTSPNWDDHPRSGFNFSSPDSHRFTKNSWWFKCYRTLTCPINITLHYIT